MIVTYFDVIISWEIRQSMQCSIHSHRTSKNLKATNTGKAWILIGWTNTGKAWDLIVWTNTGKAWDLIVWTNTGKAWDLIVSVFNNIFNSRKNILNRGKHIYGEWSGGRLRPPAGPGQCPGRGTRGAKPPVRKRRLEISGHFSWPLKHMIHPFQLFKSVFNNLN